MYFMLDTTQYGVTIFAWMVNSLLEIFLNEKVLLHLYVYH